jgi:MFS family permease
MKELMSNAPNDFFKKQR